jgi:hypothetical protein
MKKEKKLAERSTQKDSSSLGYHNIINKCYLHNQIKALVEYAKESAKRTNKVELNGMNERRQMRWVIFHYTHSRLCVYSLLFFIATTLCHDVKLCQMNKVIIVNVAWTFALNEDHKRLKVNLWKLCVTIKPASLLALSSKNSFDVGTIHVQKK